MMSGNVTFFGGFPDKLSYDQKNTNKIEASSKKINFFYSFDCYFIHSFNNLTIFNHLSCQQNKV